MVGGKKMLLKWATINHNKKTAIITTVNITKNILNRLSKLLLPPHEISSSYPVGSSSSSRIGTRTTFQRDSASSIGSVAHNYKGSRAAGEEVDFTDCVVSRGIRRIRTPSLERGISSSSGSWRIGQFDGIGAFGKLSHSFKCIHHLAFSLQTGYSTSTRENNSGMTVNTKERLTRLRALLRQKDIDAYIIPSADAHQSEYIAKCDKRRGFISGFDGSAGTAVVLADESALEAAALWTDGRYFLQAVQQMDANWTLMKEGLPETPTIQEWIAANLKQGAKVGIDPSLITNTLWEQWGSDFEKSGIDFIPVEENLVDLAWGKDRPSEPKSPVIVHELEFAGETIESKVERIRKMIKKSAAGALVVAALDQVAWVLNIRGSDIPFNPVVKSFVLITNETVTLYIDEDKLKDEKARNHLASVTIKPYNAIIQDLKQMASQNTKISLDPNSLNRTIALAADGESGNIIFERNPIVVAKALKNEREIQGFRDCHIRDGVALVKFFAWLEDELVNKKNATLTESIVSDKLDALRSHQKDNMGLSFETISGSGSNGAIIHYRATPETDALLSTDLMYLCDSGGQYLDGTTDVTRTNHFGQPTEHQKKCFTRVLQGHIALAQARFPKGTLGQTLDVLARQYLWKDGLNYLHGTGHGVGYFLNVHEGPQGIGTRQTTVPLQPSMTVTNEPGYYEAGAFGIRIENVLIVKDANTPFNFNNTPFYEFETITMAPIQTKLIAKELLSTSEISWINDYHNEVYEKLSPSLQDDLLTLHWLQKETRSIG